MKKLIILLLLGVIVSGCLNESFELYKNDAVGFSFEKPSKWVAQSDPLAFVRFGEIGKSSFAVSAKQIEMQEFENAVEEIYSEFVQNPAYRNVVRENSEIDGFQAIKIKTEQTNEENEQVIVELFTVKDSINNRLLLISFMSNEFEKAHSIENRMIDTFEIFTIRNN